MGRMQREKGKIFERSIATRLRAAFPGALVRRSSQADRAHASDVVVEPPAPSVIGRVWWECHDAANPRPLEKLAQAERDTRGLSAAGEPALPVVVWHRKGARSTRVTMRLGTLQVLIGAVPRPSSALVIELDLVDLLGWMADAARSGLLGAWTIDDAPRSGLLGAWTIGAPPVQTSAQEASS